MNVIGTVRDENRVTATVLAAVVGQAWSLEGEYNVLLAYNYYDVVSYNGKYYKAAQNVPIGKDPNDAAYWTYWFTVGLAPKGSVVKNNLPKFADNTGAELEDSGYDPTDFAASGHNHTGVYATPAGTETLTNKRISPRTGETTSSATPTINTDNVDHYLLTAQAEAITSFTTNLSGTPTEGQKLIISITGTGARAITWGTSFEASTVSLPTTTVTTNRLDVGFIWNTITSKWRIIAKS